MRATFSRDSAIHIKLAAFAQLCPQLPAPFSVIPALAQFRTCNILKKCRCVGALIDFSALQSESTSPQAFDLEVVYMKSIFNFVAYRLLPCLWFVVVTITASERALAQNECADPLVIAAIHRRGLPLVRTFNPSTGDMLTSFLAYDRNFSGGVRVASGDFNGDGCSDVVTAPGTGNAPHVKVFNPLTGTLLSEFFAFNPGFLGGVNVAVGDVNGDGLDDIITSVNGGALPQVNVFDHTGQQLYSFVAFDSSFTGGVRVASGDINGDGKDDIIASMGTGGTSLIRIFDGTDGSLMSNPIAPFLAYSTSFSGGVYVATGDVNGDGRADIITSPGSGRGRKLQVFDGTSGVLLHSFFAYGRNFRGGVTVATGDIDSDGDIEIVTGPSNRGRSKIKVFEGSSGLPILSFLFTQRRNESRKKDLIVMITPLIIGQD